MTHRSNETYGWADPAILDRMFGPVATDDWGQQSDTGGLAIDPRDLMRRAWLNGGITRYEPGPSCGWYTFDQSHGVYAEPGPR